MRTSSTGSGVTTFSYNTANEITAVNGSGSYSFDAAGNQTGSPSFSSLVYNGKNQTSSITPAGGSALSLAYAGPGQTRRVSAGGTSFSNSALGLSAETIGTNTTYYTREPGGGLTEERTPGGNYYYLEDGLGSVVALTDASGSVVNTYKYEPYGALASSTGTVPNPWRFAGYYFDTTTSLHKVGERYYATGSGRWLQRDVIDDPLDGPGWNRYIYAGDDPVNMIDPAGLFAIHPVKWAKHGYRATKRALHVGYRYLQRHRWASCTLFLASAIAGGAEALMVLRGARAAKTLTLFGKGILKRRNVGLVISGGVIIGAVTGGCASSR